MSFASGENVGAYRIIEQLGSGGMATVYKAYHAALDRYVAIKVMHPAFKGDSNFLARFQREARVVAKLEHPHIVPVYDFSEHDGSPYLVMRFVEGQTLKARLEQGPITLPEILDITRPIGEALTYAHEQGVLHRDIKPSNVLLSDDGKVFLTDYGLARIVQAGESSLTRDALVGTPYYISPEQAIGKSELDARTDIYSFGVVLYELLTGRVPFRSDTPFAVIHDHIYTPLPMPTSVNPNLPPALERVLLKAMAKEPDDRYESALDLLAAMEDAVTGVAAIPPARPAVAPTPTPAPVVESAKFEPLSEPTPAPSVAKEPPKDKSQRRPWLLALGGLAVLAVVAVVAIVLLSGGKDEQAKPELIERPTQAIVEPPLIDLTPFGQEMPGDIERGIELVANGDIDGALAIFERIIQQNPNANAVYLEAALVLIQHNYFDPAVDILRRGVDANPNDPALHLNLGQALIGADRWEEAVPEFEWLIGREPDMAEPHAYMSVYLAVEKDNLDGARAEADKALDLDPESPEAHFAQGVFYWKSGNFRLARRELELAQQSPRASLMLQMRIELFLNRLEQSKPESP